MRRALLTGGAGFVGSHLLDHLLDDGWRVTVVDNFDPYYSPKTKLRNIERHLGDARVTLLNIDIRNLSALRNHLDGQYDVVLHLAAKAGVRPSIQDPLSYCHSNVEGTYNLLELSKTWGIEQFIFASSSSVYGVNPNAPWRESDNVLMPISPYASTKVSGELLGHVYSRLYGIRFIALRFFTVYGPRQRPDLAIHKFARLMLQGKPIPIYGDGSTRRDYTHVTDIVDGVCAAIEYRATPYEVINLGNNRAVSLNQLIVTLENGVGARAVISRGPEQPGDVPQTYADTRKAKALLGYESKKDFNVGICEFVQWLREELACRAGSADPPERLL